MLKNIFATIGALAVSALLLVGILGMTPKPTQTKVIAKKSIVSVKSKASKPKEVRKTDEITETKVALTKEYKQVLEVQ